MNRSISVFLTIIIFITSAPLFGQVEYKPSSYFYFPRIKKKKLKPVTIFLDSGEKAKGYIYDVNEAGVTLIPNRIKDPMDIVLSHCSDCMLIKHDEIDKMLYMTKRNSMYITLGLGVGMAMGGFIAFEASKPHEFLEGAFPAFMGYSGGLLTLTSGIGIVMDESKQNPRQKKHKEGEVCYRCESFKKLTLLSMVEETAKKQFDRLPALTSKVKKSHHLYLQEYNIYLKDSSSKLKAYFVSMAENKLLFSPNWSSIIEQRRGAEGEIIEVNLEDLLFIEVIKD